MIAWLADLELSHGDIGLTPGLRFVATHRFAFTWDIVIGPIGRDNDPVLLDDRWSYPTRARAAEALAAWAEGGYQDEPEGWHRHPGSGRLRPGGDARFETIER